MPSATTRSCLYQIREGSRCWKLDNTRMVHWNWGTQPAWGSLHYFKQPRWSEGNSDEARFGDFFPPFLPLSQHFARKDFVKMWKYFVRNYLFRKQLSCRFVQWNNNGDNYGQDLWWFVSEAKQGGAMWEMWGCSRNRTFIFSSVVSALSSELCGLLGSSSAVRIFRMLSRVPWSSH